MPVPYDRVRLVINGTIASTQTWSTALTVHSFTAANMDSVDQAAMNDFVNGAVPLVAKWLSTQSDGAGISARNLWSGDTRADHLTAYLYKAGSDKASLVATAPTPTGALGLGTTPHPTQTCLVVSTRTEQPGRHGRGRMYVPMTGYALDATHQVDATGSNGLALVTARLIHDINVLGIGQDDSTCIVASTAGPFRIARVEVDSEPDVQRRRADKIVAARKGVVAIPTS